MEKCDHQLGFSVFVPGYDSDYDIEFITLKEKVEKKDLYYSIEFDFCPKCGTKLLDKTGKLLLENLL